jgi:hypothetical protein
MYKPVAKDVDCFCLVYEASPSLQYTFKLSFTSLLEARKNARSHHRVDMVMVNSMIMILANIKSTVCSIDSLPCKTALDWRDLTASVANFFLVEVRKCWNETRPSENTLQVNGNWNDYRTFFVIEIQGFPNFKASLEFDESNIIIVYDRDILFTLPLTSITPRTVESIVQLLLADTFHGLAV